MEGGESTHHNLLFNFPLFFRYTVIEAFATPGKGWGIRGKADVKAGDFIIEYVGEVVDVKTSEARLKERLGQGDKHMY